jgi:hypothetical protein
VYTQVLDDPSARPPGGRLAVSDIVMRGDSVPEPVRRSMELWVESIAGALEESRYRERLTHAGFARVDVESTRIYRERAIENDPANASTFLHSTD